MSIPGLCGPPLFYVKALAYIKKRWQSNQLHSKPPLLCMPSRSSDLRKLRMSLTMGYSLHLLCKNGWKSVNESTPQSWTRDYSFIGLIDLDNKHMATERTTHMCCALSVARQCIDRDLVCCGEHESKKVDAPDCRFCCTAIVGMYEL